MRARACICALVLAWAGSVNAGDEAIDSGTYLSVQHGGGRTEGGHPDNNHRDGFALQWAGVRQLDDTRWGLLLSAALRMRLFSAPEGTYLRLGFNHAQVPGMHRSDALMLGLARQFGPVGQGPIADTSTPLWLGVAGQLRYVQEVTPGFSMSAGIGPYFARNRRESVQADTGAPVRGNLLISLEAERALSPDTRVFFDVGRVKPSSGWMTAICFWWGYASGIRIVS